MASNAAKRDLLEMIRRHGANGTITALAGALRQLGSAWNGDGGAAEGVESVTGYAPFSPDDWKNIAEHTPRG